MRLALLPSNALPIAVRRGRIPMTRARLDLLHPSNTLRRLSRPRMCWRMLNSTPLPSNVVLAQSRSAGWAKPGSPGVTAGGLTTLSGWLRSAALPRRHQCGPTDRGGGYPTTMGHASPFGYGFRIMHLRLARVGELLDTVRGSWAATAFAPAEEPTARSASAR